MKCIDCKNFLKHPRYDLDKKYHEGHCLAVDGYVHPSSYIKNPDKEIQCSLFTLQK